MARGRSVATNVWSVEGHTIENTGGTGEKLTDSKRDETSFSRETPGGARDHLSGPTREIILVSAAQYCAFERDKLNMLEEVSGLRLIHTEEESFRLSQDPFR